MRVGEMPHVKKFKNLFPEVGEMEYDMFFVTRRAIHNFIVSNGDEGRNYFAI